MQDMNQNHSLVLSFYFCNTELTQKGKSIPDQILVGHPS